MTTTNGGMAWREGVRSALRLIRKDPVFSATVILTLAIGMGAATAIFTVFNGVLLRPLPYADPNRLVAVQQRGRGGLNPFSRPKEFAAWQQQTRTLEEVAAYGWNQANLSGAGEPERIDCGYASASLFRLLEVHTALGRTFAQDAEHPGSSKVVLLSHSFWQRHFGGNRDVLGRSLLLNGISYSIIGVLPESFVIPEKWASDEYPIWLPLESDARGGPVLVYVLGRLKPGVSLAKASAELDVILRPLLSQRRQDVHAVAASWQDEVTSLAKRPLLIFFAAVNLVLVIACVNVAGLLLARATMRQNEIAVRSAIGASSTQIVSQLFTESIVLSVIGSVCGLVFAMVGKDALMVFLASNLPSLQPIGLDYRVLAFNALLAVATGVACGLPPALHARSGRLHESLKANSRGTTGGGSMASLRNLLVAAEVAIAVVVLAGAGLLMRSFLQLSRINLGFEAKSVLTLELRLTPQYRSPREQRIFSQEVLRRISRLPGVESAAATTALPLGLNSYGAHEIKVEGLTEHTGDVDLAIVSRDYFRAIRLPLRQGRVFDESDREGTAATAIVNETFRRQYCPGTQCLGRILEGILSSGDRVVVVGVVGDVRQRLEQSAQPQIYLPLDQHPSDILTLVVRTVNPPMSMARGVKSEIAAVDRTLPPFRIMPLEQFRTDSLVSQRVNMWLSASFAMLALLLAAVGVYGVISYSVGQRRHEIGLRMALGANQGEVFRMVVARGLRLVASGAAVGVLVSLWLNRLLTNQLWGVTPADPPTLLLVAATLGLTGIIACAVPARRAAAVDPIAALRQD